jgi:hypothetical protein
LGVEPMPLVASSAPGLVPNRARELARRADASQRDDGGE